MKLTREMLEGLIMEEIEKMKAEEDAETLEEDDEAEKERRFCASKGYYELERLLRIQNRIALASKGDLGKKA